VNVSIQPTRETIAQANRLATRLQSKTEGVSVAYLMELWGTSNQVIENLASDGIIRRVAQGRYAEDSTAQYIKYLRDSPQGKFDGEVGCIDIGQESALLKRANRELAELKYEIMSGALVKKDLVTKEWLNKVRSFRGALLSLPSKIRGSFRLSVESEEKIEDMVYGILDEFGGD